MPHWGVVAHPLRHGNTLYSVYCRGCMCWAGRAGGAEALGPPGKAAVVFMYDFTVEYAGPNRVSVMYFPPVVDLLYMPKALSKARGVYGEEPGPN